MPASCLSTCASWGGRCGWSAILTRLEATTSDRVLAVTLAPADGWDSPLRQPGVRRVTSREVEHQRREEESRAIAAELDAHSSYMRLHEGDVFGAAPGEPPEEWLVHWQALSSSGASARPGRAAVPASLSSAAPRCTVRVTAEQVELRSSGADGVTDTAAGLVLEVCAREVVLDLPPGVPTWLSGPGGLRECESETVVRLLAAWIRASGARSVWLKPWREVRHAAAAELAGVMLMNFKQAGVPQQLVLGLVLGVEPTLTQLGARHQLSCTNKVNSDGSACGLLFEPML